jgi:hypothetical protein
MTKFVLQLLSVSTILAGAALADDHQLKAQVQFPFVVAGVSMPAGSYTIETSSEQQVVYISNGLRRIAVLATGSVAATNSNEASLKFSRTGDHYTLAEVQLIGEPGLFFRKGQ